MRPNWDEYFMSIAQVVKSRSLDIRKVGAVLVSMMDHRIISTGYNSLPAGMNDYDIDWNDRERVHKIIVHAETNALLYARSMYEDAILYCTMSPCQNCIKLLSATRIKKIVYYQPYRDLEAVTELCKYFGIELQQLNVQ